MKRLKSWNWTLILCAILLGVNLWQGKRLSELERDIWNAQNSVMNNVSRMDQRLSSLYAELESADDLVRDWSYTTSVDMEKQRLNVDVAVDLKEWSEGTAVEVVWENLYGESLEGAERLTETSAGSFRGTLELPGLERLNEISLNAVITNGGTQRRENLGNIGDVAGLLPLQCNSWGTSGPLYRGGVFTLSNCSADLHSQSEKVPEEIENAVFRLLRNGEAVAERTAKQGYTMGNYECNEEMSVESQIGDKLTLTFSCRDQYGLGYEFFLYGWKITGEGGLMDFAPDTDWPKLTWN